MIFSFWYIFWLISAASVAAFLIPYLALLLRAAYVDQRIVLLRPAHLTIASFIFLGLLFLGTAGLEGAGLLTLQVIGFMGLSYHLLERVKSVRAKRLPRAVALVTLIGSRYFSVIKEKRSDFEYAVRLRGRLVEGSALSRLRLRLRMTFKAIGAAMVDFVILANQIYAVIQARGGLPSPQALMAVREGRQGAAVFVVADLALVLLLVVIIISGGDGFIPAPVQDALGFLRLR